MKLISKLIDFLYKKAFVIFLLAIILLAASLRIYQIDKMPPSLSWDEAAVGYNAWTIANYGRDEWGKIFPIVFKSFEDDKHPIHIYSTAISVKLLGLNEFSTRIPAAIFGVLNVILLFFTGKLLFNSKAIGLIAAFILAISPYNIHFSRFSHELNFVIFFFLLGVVCFFQGLKNQKNLISVAFFSFGIDLLAYHSAKVVVPPLLILITILYFKELMRVKKHFFIGVIIFFSFIFLIILNPALTGRARINQTSFGKDMIEKTEIYQKTQNEILGRAEITFNQYLSHFSKKYLFISGDRNPRLSSQITGEFYLVDALFLGVGFLALLRKKSKVSIILISWALLGPIPSSLVNEAPHASRAMFMTGSWHLISALGFFTILNILKNRYLQLTALVTGLSIYMFLLRDYSIGYFTEYSQKYAIEWQYGMKEIVEFAKNHPEYYLVYTTNVRSQPYIFYLYYLKTPVSTLLNTIDYNDTKSRSYNLVFSFDRYRFDGWNPIESMPNKYILYVVSPSEYSGLRHKAEFDVKKVIRYPNGTDAFFLVSAD